MPAEHTEDTEDTEEFLKSWFRLHDWNGPVNASGLYFGILYFRVFRVFRRPPLLRSIASRRFLNHRRSFTSLIVEPVYRQRP